jgi:hypothetical protein
MRERKRRVRKAEVKNADVSRYVGMSEKDFLQVVVDTIKNRWKRDFPDYQHHRTILAGPDKFLCHVLNAVERTDFSRGGYCIERWQATAGRVSQDAERERLIQDIQTCGDLRIWMIEVIGG